MTRSHFQNGLNQRLSCGALIFIFLLASSIVNAQDNRRWFQIEVSIFSNELAADRAEERWDVDGTLLIYPANINELRQLSDLLMIEELLISGNFSSIEIEPENSDTSEPNPTNLLSETERRNELILSKGPLQQSVGSSFQFVDVDRDEFLQLPPYESEFQQTNRSIERSSDHRLLFHGLWRQPVVDLDESKPVFVRGGLAYGQHFELEGSLILRFNDNENRVVVDADLWLSEFSAVANSNQPWQLPDYPAAIKPPTIPAVGSPEYHIRQIFHLQQSRDMRSEEFHYVDHPALGLVIMVKPYEVPEIPVAETEF